MRNVYSKRFFAPYENGSRSSAREMLPFVFSLLAHDAIVDVGCGKGTWLQAAKELGVKRVIGLDGEYLDKSILAIEESEFRPADLTEPIRFDGARFDLAMCMEVGEHLPPSASSTLVASLVSLAPAVLFSAAIPTQGGTGHVNEQWPEYWSKLFKQHEYDCIDVMRQKFWNNHAVEPWYVQNTFLYVNKPSDLLLPYATEEPFALVHTAILEISRRNAAASASPGYRLRRAVRSSIKLLFT